MRRAAQLRLRRAVLSALFIGGAFPIAGPLSAACAAPGSAALVVDTGEATSAYCVALPSSSVSGIELIQLAGEQHGLQYSLGYGGGAVCQLEGVGPDGQDCFAEHPDFWGYWRGDGSGGWAWSGTGAGSTTVEAGDVEGWSWGSGQDASTHQQPPATTYGSVCGAPPAPTESGDDGEGDKPASSGGGDGEGNDSQSNAYDEPSDAAVSSPAAGGQGAKRTKAGKRKEERGRPQQERLASPEPSSSPDRADEADAASHEATSPTAQETDGAPVAGLAGLGLTALLGGAGLFVRGRRKRGA